eukprot:10269381-Alexandrium_andersonii.AAC.1
MGGGTRGDVGGKGQAAKRIRLSENPDDEEDDSENTNQEKLTVLRRGGLGACGTDRKASTTTPPMLQLMRISNGRSA